MRINRIAMVLLFLMGIYILAASGTVLCANLVEMAPDQVLETMKDCLVKEAAANIYPGMFIPEEKEQEFNIALEKGTLRVGRCMYEREKNKYTED